MLKMSKKRMLTLSVVIMLSGILLWLSLRSVKIIAVHQDGNYSEVLVKDYPFTDEGKIKWWLKNKAILKEKYNIPRPSEDGRYHVILWDFGDGYKEGDGYDSLCFDDMPPPINCIDKNKVITIGHNINSPASFTVSGGVYILQYNGLILKRKRQE
ncbi:DUF943 family protein [Erwinia sp. MYb375]|uniref:DUF943 family protein n=2 Tax=Erwinia sp. MYb375 TaxID=2745272 RepID=UPI0030A8CE6F